MQIFGCTQESRRQVFSTSGRVRAIEACQLLRAAQVGGLPDARLELNVHDLLLRQGLSRGPWIGDEIVAPTETAGVSPSTLRGLLARPGRRAFVPSSTPAGFLELRAEAFEERDASGATLGTRVLESCVPRPLSTNTIAVAVLARAGAQILLGVDEDDLPAAQAFHGNSNLLVAPAWRLPHGNTTTSAARAFALARLRETYGLTCDEIWDLGGAYRPSPGLTPELVQPVVARVSSVAPATRALAFVPLSELLAHRAALHDGHLRIAVSRLAHALDIA